MTILYLLIVICMRVVQSYYSKKVNIALPDSMRAYVKYITISNFFATCLGFLMLVVGGRYSGFNMQGFIIALCSGLFLSLSSLCGIQSLKGGTMVLHSIFSTAGLIIPCVLGIFVFDEPMNFIQVICIFLFFASSVLVIDSSKSIFGDFSPKMLVYLLGSMISNGMTMFCQKLFGQLQPDGNITMFSMMTFLIPTVVLYFSLKFIDPAKHEEQPFPKQITLYALLLAAAVFLIQQIVTILTPVLSSAVLFSFVMGGATIVTTIVGALVYKEKITKKSAFGITTALLSMLCIKMFES